MSGYYQYIGAAPVAPSPYYVLLATPATNHPECNHSKSMAATVETLSRAGVQFDFLMVQGSCHVDDVRNGIIRDFLKFERPRSDSPNCRHTYTDLFFIDADMGWDAKGVLDLLMAPGDVVAGVYRHKNDTETYPFVAGQFEGLGKNENNLFEMEKAATGFMRIRRPVLEKLTEVERGGGLRKSGFPRAWWPNPDDEKANPNHSVARIVERGWPREVGIPKEVHAGNDYQSGDYMLCLKARAAGFRVFVDPDMQFSHAGAQVWQGHFGNHLRRQQRVLPQPFLDAVEVLRAGKAEPDTFAALFEGWDIISGRSPMNNPWTLEAEALAELYARAREATQPVLEMGSGLTTVVLGLALQGSGLAVHVLECHLESWRDTAAILNRLAIKNVVLHYAPLVPIGPKADEVAYGEAELPEGFGLVLVDGPYHSPQRKTALWALRARIRAATLLLDDVDTSIGLLEMLRKAGHAVDVREGGKKRWAVAVPSGTDPRAKAFAAPKARLEPVVVSLTSHPPRYKHLHHALQSLLNQDVKPDATVLWLTRAEFAALPSTVLRMDGLTIRQVEEDIRSYKKLVPALEAYPDAYIVTADDDLVYPPSWLRELAEAHRSDKEILLRRGRLPTNTPDGSIGSYNTWPLAWKPGDSNSGLFPTSCHGMLVPPCAMAPEVLDMAKARSLCPMNDDIWWYWMGLLGGSTFRLIDSSQPIYDLPSGADGLWSQHNRDGGNDRQIAAMVEAYGMPWVSQPAEAAE
ncbi:MAG TPA: glycosyltransferase family A protein [Hyphomicrobiaceae bacterium]|nr:glycosyltransferase family A protein [Hyphomicrobiaceae bacterium]